MKENKIKSSFAESGFTLLEVMVVVSIMALVLTMVIPRINNKNRELKSTLRKFTVLSKDLHSRAKLTNSTYRIAVDLKGGDNREKDPQTYWVEKSSGTGPFTTPENIAELRKEAEENSSDDEKKKGPQATPDGFTIDTRIIKKPQELPTGLVFTEIELASTDKSYQEGLVYIHYSPKGLVEEAALHLKLQDVAEWTIAIHPLTGKADLVGKNISLKEIKDQ